MDTTTTVLIVARRTCGEMIGAIPAGTPYDIVAGAIKKWIEKGLVIDTASLENVGSELGVCLQPTCTCVPDNQMALPEMEDSTKDLRFRCDYGQFKPDVYQNATMPRARLSVTNYGVSRGGYKVVLKLGTQRGGYKEHTKERILDKAEAAEKVAELHQLALVEYGEPTIKIDHPLVTSRARDTEVIP